MYGGGEGRWRKSQARKRDKIKDTLDSENVLLKKTIAIAQATLSCIATFVTHSKRTVSMPRLSLWATGISSMSIKDVGGGVLTVLQRYRPGRRLRYNQAVACTRYIEPPGIFWYI
jgi:hypothetical protein